MNISVNFKQVNLRYENTGRSQAQLDKISIMTFNILDEKIKNDNSKELRAEQEKNVYFDRINIPSIVIDPAKSDYQIALKCASAIYLQLVERLR